MSETTAAIGNFDGIHIGHDSIFRKCIEIGNKTGQAKKVITFEYEFDKFTNISKKYKKIYGKHGKIGSLKQYPLDDIIFFSLDSMTAVMTPEEFVSEILVKKLSIKNIVVGFNFRFGYKAKGDTKVLNDLSHKYGYQVTIIEAVRRNGQIISSTYIRDLISKGNLKLANELLTENYRFDLRDHRMTVLSENQILLTDNDFVYPPSGKYLTYIDGKQCELTLDHQQEGLLVECKALKAPRIVEFLEKI
jgi:riboflavin kinase/FMN adenylyltransferase